MHRHILTILTGVLAALIWSGCSVSEWEQGFIPIEPVGSGNGAGQGGNTGDRTHNEDRRKVLLLYSAGYNSLRNYLLEDIEDLKSGWLPKDYPNHDILLVYTHTTQRNGAYGIPTTPYLIRLYEDGNGNAVADTLVTYEAGTHSATAEQFHNVLTYVRNNFPAGNYGMVFSSHATGYLPSGFYSKPESYEYIPKKSVMRQIGDGFDALPMTFETRPVPYHAPDFDPSLPMVKSADGTEEGTPMVRSVGQDQVGSAGEYVSYEMEIAEFADAIPMKFDYILFDACLMGGVEVAYELKGKCGKVGFSQAEVLAEGLDYKTLTNHLLKEKKADPQGVCEDYFKQYESQSGVYQSATISLIDCKKMDALAEVCRELFSSWKYKDILKTMDPDKVQRFYRFDKHWFYDLASILIEADIDAEELGRLSSALDECVLYKAHTPEFMCEFEIEIFSGLSMYLPSVGSTELDKYYKTLLWNRDTGLVK